MSEAPAVGTDVRHSQSRMSGVVLSTFTPASPYLGDLAGPWAAVQWSDGFRSSVPVTTLEIIR